MNDVYFIYAGFGSQLSTKEHIIDHYKDVSDFYSLRAINDTESATIDKFKNNHNNMRYRPKFVVSFLKQNDKIKLQNVFTVEEFGKYLVLL